MNSKPPQGRGQRAVREERFNKALTAMNFEMAQKTAKAMAGFHHTYVAPLERRILLIETLTGIRLLRWIRWTLYRGYRWVLGKVLAGWHHFYMWVSEAIPEEVKEEGEFRREDCPVCMSAAPCYAHEMEQSEIPKDQQTGICGVCRKPMPEGEEMFAYHGNSGSCPWPPDPPEPEHDGVGRILSLDD